MDQHPSPSARSVFDHALEIDSPAQRETYLSDACGDDPILRRKVDSLLAAYEQAGSFLEAGQPGLGRTVDDAEARLREAPGSVIGRFKLLEKIGEGGFGTVFMAEQLTPVRRKVALKVIKPGMDTRQVIARFEAERQALALMDHPNIAHVYDAGATDTGRPYFVMELVRGVPITEYCDTNNLSTPERLELFIPVCHAVQHAHQKGVIHRDLKPSNILVTMADGRPIPKVIDFGIAKATNARLTEATLFTEYRQLVGTPEYMSPEQAEMTGIDVDTRSDVYSLGVLLYELLTGTTPFDPKELRSKAYAEIQRMIREVEPPRPSTRISGLGKTLATTAAHRSIEPRKLGQLMRGELDWVVMKSLEKDRTRRYGTASGLARDIERYLRDEPVEACPTGAGYRLRKFVKRNKGRVAAAGLVLAALLAGMAGTTWGMIRAEQARQDAVSAQFAEAERAEGERRAKEDAQKRLAQIEKGTEILASVFRNLDPTAEERGGVTLHVLLGRRLGEAARQLEGEAVGDPLVVARLQHILGISLRELGHLNQAELVLVKACRTRERLLGADHLDTVATKHDLALLYRHQGKYAPAEALHMQVLAARTARIGADHPDTLTSQHHLALLYWDQGKRAPAEALHREVLAARTARLGADHPDTLSSQHRLAQVYRSQGKFALAEALTKEVLAARTARLGADRLDTVATKANLAAVYYSQGKYALAEELCREVLAVRTAKLGADHPDTLGIQHYLALLHQAQGRYALAESLYKEVLATHTAKLGANHAITLGIKDSLIGLYLLQGEHASAETLYKETLAVRTAKLGADHHETLNNEFDLAILYRAMNKRELAIPLLEETLKRSKANGHPNALEMQANLGAMYCDVRRFADAIVLLDEVHRTGNQVPHLAAFVGHFLMRSYVGAGKTTEAVALATEQVRAARQQFSADSPELAAALADAGKWLLDAKAYAAAEPLLRESLSLGGKTAPALERLVRLYDDWGNPDEAAKWRKELEAARGE